jgi:uncharacterized membrane protein YiaA
MKPLSEALISTLIHTIEIAVILGVVYLVITLFNLPLNEELTALIIAAIVKFTRTFDAIPVPDYVNDKS